jgi:hypothetical protein
LYIFIQQSIFFEIDLWTFIIVCHWLSPSTRYHVEEQCCLLTALESTSDSPPCKGIVLVNDHAGEKVLSLEAPKGTN